MLVLGVDPGTATTGYGLVKESARVPVMVAYGCIRTSKDLEMPQRLEIISNELSGIINKYAPDVVAVEKLFFAANSKTAIKVGEARGVILHTAAVSGRKVAEYTPLQVKQALTGYGAADKKQIQFMVKNLLKLDEIPKPDDAADALAIAICHLNSYRIGGMK